MKFAICNETFQNWPHEQAFAYAAENGYSGIEFAPYTLGDSPTGISAAERSHLASLSAAHGLEVIGLHWLLAFTEGYYLTSPDPAIRARTSDYLGELARLCADLGGRIMVLGSPKQRNLLPGVTHEDAMKYAADVIQLALPTLEETNVVLAVEPLGPQEGDFLLTADAGAELVAMVDSPFCQLHLDVKAMSSEGKPIDEIIRQHASITAHFHANDANRRGPGMGEIDFVPILRALKETGYAGWVSVEVFDYEPGVEALARESIENLRKAWAAVNTFNARD